MCFPLILLALSHKLDFFIPLLPFQNWERDICVALCHFNNLFCTTMYLTINLIPIHKEGWTLGRVNVFSSHGSQVGVNIDQNELLGLDHRSFASKLMLHAELKV